MAIEVELKKETPLRNPKAFCPCGEPANRTVTIGRTQDHYGTEFEICASEDCLNHTMDNLIEDLFYIRNHRWELMHQDQWNFREGK